MEILRCRYRPWPDLPDPLLEIILERLPLSAYVCFPAVCRRWLSVQAAHRRRHSPSPPPMLRLPWLVRSIPKSPEEIVISCYSPFEDSLFAIPLPSLRFCSPQSRLEHPLLLTCWWLIPLLLVLLFNTLRWPAPDAPRWRGVPHLLEFDERPLLVTETDKYVNGCLARDRVGIGLFRLDLGRKTWVKVDSIGDDRVLVVHWFHSSRSVSLLASDIGARGNCVYFSTEKTDVRQPRWKMFDLGAGSDADFLPPNASQFMNNRHLFLVPSLC